VAVIYPLLLAALGFVTPREADRLRALVARLLSGRAARTATPGTAELAGEIVGMPLPGAEVVRSDADPPVARPAPGPAARSDTGRLGLLVFAVALLVYGATAGGSLTTTDAVAAYELTESLVERRSVALEWNVVGLEAALGPDGRAYSPFGIAQSIVNIPFYLAGRELEAVTGLRLGPPDAIRRAAVAGASVVAAALTVLVTFLFAWRLSRDPAASVGASLVVAFGTLLWPYSGFGFNTALTALFLLTGVYLLWTGRQPGEPSRVLWSGLAFGAASLTRHEMFLAALPAALWLLSDSTMTWRVRRRLVAMLAIGFTAAVALSLWYNVARFGHPLDAGQLRDTNVRLGSTISGLYGLLFAPGQSLLLYAPIVVAGLATTIGLSTLDRSARRLILAFLLTFLLFYSSLVNWVGGRSYGPRYLVPLLPLVCVALAPAFVRFRATRLRLVLHGLILISVAVQIPGVLVDYSKVRLDHARTFHADAQPDWRYAWDESSLVLNTRALGAAVPLNLRHLTGAEAPPPIARAAREGDRGFGQQLVFSLDLWWMYLFYLGALPPGAAVAAGLLPIVLAIAIGWRLARSLRPREPGDVAADRAGVTVRP
jgi:hypothetical protein